MHDVATLAYAAGIMDGEGYIGITVLEASKSRPSRSPTFQLVVNVGMADFGSVAFLHEQFGGNIHSYAPGKYGTKRGVHHWRLTGLRARRFCSLVAPYLRVKQAQAALAIRYYDDPQLHHGMRGPKRLSTDEVSRRREYVREVQQLNQRIARVA